MKALLLSSGDAASVLTQYLFQSRLMMLVSSEVLKIETSSE